MNIFIRSSRDPRKKQTTPRLITTVLNPKRFEKVAYIKSIHIKGVISPSEAKGNGESRTNEHSHNWHRHHSTKFTLLLELNVICGQRWIQFEWQNSLSKAFVINGKITLPLGKSVKSDLN